MATEFDEQLKQRLLAFQAHHGLAGTGRVEGDTWSRLVAGASGGSGDAQAAQAVVGQQIASGPAYFTPEAESMTNEQILEAWHKSTNLNDFKLRIQLGPVTDERLFEFLRRKKIVLPEKEPFTGPSARQLPKSEKIVGRIISSPLPEGGQSNKYVTGTEAELEQLQRDENDRGTMIGLQGIASAGRGKGSANPSVRHTAAPARATTPTGPRTPGPASNPKKPAAAGGPPKTPPAGGAPKTPPAAGGAPKAATPASNPKPQGPTTPATPAPPQGGGPPSSAPPSSAAPGSMTPAALAAEVRAARDYYPGHGGETGSLLVPGQAPMRIKSGVDGGPWGGTHRGGIPRGRREAFTSGGPSQGNIATHVEGHTAAIMHQQGITQATLVMGVDQCKICAHNLPTALPPGAELTVITVINGNVDRNVYRSSQIP